MEKVLTLRRLATASRLPQRWLKQEAAAGRLPCLRVGRKLLFSLEAVKAHLARRAATERAGQGAVPPGPAE
jgi:hypothetical protein